MQSIFEYKKTNTWAQGSGVMISGVAMSEDLTPVHCWCSRTPRQCSGRGRPLAWSCLALHPDSDLETLLVGTAAGLGVHPPAAAVVEQPKQSMNTISSNTFQTSLVNMEVSLPAVGACSYSGGPAWHSLGGRDGLVEDQQALQLEWMEAEAVAASRLARFPAAARESLAWWSLSLKAEHKTQ